MAKPHQLSGRLTVEMPIDLIERIGEAATTSRRSVHEFVHEVLAREIERWDKAFPLPALPTDVRAALGANSAAAAFFATVSRRNYHAILDHIEKAKRPATRTRRIERAIAMLARKETPYRQ